MFRNLRLAQTGRRVGLTFCKPSYDDKKHSKSIVCENETKLPRVPMEAQLAGIWDEARAFYFASLTGRERIHVTEETSLEGLIEEASKLKTRYRKRRLVVLLRKINPFLVQLRSFSRIINTLVQSHPEIAALVWGSFSLILEASPSVRHTSDKSELTGSYLACCSPRKHP
jgi:hypothetical protein